MFFHLYAWRSHGGIIRYVDFVVSPSLLSLCRVCGVFITVYKLAKSAQTPWREQTLRPGLSLSPFFRPFSFTRGTRLFIFPLPFSSDSLVLFGADPICCLRVSRASFSFTPPARNAVRWRRDFVSTGSKLHRKIMTGPTRRWLDYSSAGKVNYATIQLLSGSTEFFQLLENLLLFNL